MASVLDWPGRFRSRLSSTVIPIPTGPNAKRRPEYRMDGNIFVNRVIRDPALTRALTAGVGGLGCARQQAQRRVGPNADLAGRFQVEGNICLQKSSYTTKYIATDQFCGFSTADYKIRSPNTMLTCIPPVNCTGWPDHCGLTQPDPDVAGIGVGSPIVCCFLFIIIVAELAKHANHLKVILSFVLTALIAAIASVAVFLSPAARP